MSSSKFTVLDFCFNFDALLFACVFTWELWWPLLGGIGSGYGYIT